jgi:hypothetical protein
MEEQAGAALVQGRRGPAEITQLLAEYQASGLSQMAFCRQAGLSLATLARYRKRQAEGKATSGSGWLAVEVTGGQKGPGMGASSGLALTMAGGLRIEIGRGFDSRTLAQLLGVLARI